MKKVLFTFLFGLIVVCFSACEFMSDDVEPIVKQENTDGNMGGQGGGEDHKETPD